jgi:polyisoprenoid-binding protein YceI
MGSSRRALRERSRFRHTRATTVVSQAPRLSTPLVSDRLRRSQASWTASSDSVIFSGNGTVSPDGEVSGTVTVTSESIDTRNARRDTHLRSSDFFDSGHKPDITFTADGIRPSGQGVAVTGALTVRGRTRPMSFDALASVRADGEIWLDAEVRINRADFGRTWNLMGLVSMNNILIIHAVFTRR